MKNLNFSISVVIPVRDDFRQLLFVIKGVNEQVYLPKEIVVIDSSSNNLIGNYAKKYSGSVPINYYKIKSAYPGKARNIGVKKTKEEWIAFLDSKTIPTKYWLKNNMEHIIHNSRYNIIFGCTQYQAKSLKQKIIRAATFGLVGHETTPGTLMKKKDFVSSNEFVETVRAGEDLEWRNRIKKNRLFNIGYNNDITLTYSFLPDKILQILNKYFNYSFHSAYLNIQRNIKDLYLSIFLIFTAIIIPQWNLLLDGFDKHPLYVPNITKIYIICLLSILIINNFWRNVYSKNIFSTFFTLCLKIIIFTLTFIAIFNWEKTFGKLVNFNIWEIPHITKFFLLTIVLSSLLYRGLYLPIISKVEYFFLFPFNWVFVGVVGLSIDIIKAPGYLLGAFFAPFYYWFPLFKDNIKTNLFNQETTNELELKKILFICPYPEGVQAGQRLKYEQHFESFYSHGFDIKVSPFMDLNFWRIIYKKGYFLNKFLGTFNGYLRRLFNLFQLRNYDVIYIHMWVTPFGTGLFEYIFRKLSKRIIYDIEDNILMLKKSEINPITFFLKSRKKIEYLLKNADQIITSAPDLNDKCISITNKNNCTYICASINRNRFNQYKIHKNKNIPVIGWTGTFSSMQYLDGLIQIFKTISKLRKFKLRIIGNFDYNIEGLNVEVLKWKKETEINDLLEIDIGIYPLLDDKDWVLGKSGLKALQYMALGIPPVASNIGNIKNIIIHMKNGILVNSKQEWIKFLIRLIDDYNLRTRLGREAINTVNHSYTVDVLSKKYLNVLDKL